MHVIVYSSDLKRNATGLCTYEVCKTLRSRGHKVNIINLDRYDSIEEEGNICIHNVKSDLIRRLIITCIEEKHTIFEKILKRFLGILIQLKSLFTLVPLFSRHRILVRKTKEILKNSECDLIIAVVNPVESLIAADYISKKYKIKYCAYFLDSIYGNNGVRILSEVAYKKRAFRFEEKYLKSASKVFMMNSSKGMYFLGGMGEPSFMDKIMYVDIPLLKFEEIDCSNFNKYWNNSQVVVLYVGTMPKNIRSPHYVLEVFNEVAQNHIHLYFVGRSDYNDLINEYANKNDNIHYLGYINHDEVKEMLLDASILLNIGNSIDTMMPSKIFEYMSFGKPIISTRKLDSDKTDYYLNIYGNAMIVDERENIKVNIENVRRFICDACQAQNENIHNLAKLCSPNGPLYSNTPECICHHFETL